MSDDNTFKPKVITLKHPVDNGEGGLLEEIVIKREPLWGDTEHISDASPLRDMMRLCQKLSGVPIPILKKLKQEDASTVMEQLSSFL